MSLSTYRFNGFYDFIFIFTLPFSLNDQTEYMVDAAEKASTLKNSYEKCVYATLWVETELIDWSTTWKLSTSIVAVFTLTLWLLLLILFYFIYLDMLQWFQEIKNV